MEYLDGRRARQMSVKPIQKWLVQTNHICFNNWFRSVALPYCTHLEGKIVLISENLSSHFNYDILKECEHHNISFVCLLANATHLLQPFDVAYFCPMKNKWRAILTQYKLSKTKNAGTVPKDIFPKLLPKLMVDLPNQSANLVAGFEKCRIYPLSAEPVLRRIPRDDNQQNTDNQHISIRCLHCAAQTLALWWQL